MNCWSEYQFQRQASLRDVVDTLIEGKVIQHHVTIPEGLTSEQIIARLQENDILSGQVKEIPKEGTLLPETYRFTRGMTREQIIQRMEFKRLDRVLIVRRGEDVARLAAGQFRHLETIELGHLDIQKHQVG